MAEFAKISSAIALSNKYNWAINNADIDATGNLRLISIKKYLKCTGQIQVKVDKLYKDWMSTFRVFVKYSQRIYNNEKITKNMMIRCEIDSE